MNETEVVCSFDFKVSRLVGPFTTGMDFAFAVTVRPETTVLVKVGNRLEPARLRIKVAGVLMDPEN